MLMNDLFLIGLGFFCALGGGLVALVIYRILGGK